jgi:hypothetical protein
VRRSSMASMSAPAAVTTPNGGCRRARVRTPGKSASIEVRAASRGRTTIGPRGAECSAGRDAAAHGAHVVVRAGSGGCREGHRSAPRAGRWVAPAGPPYCRSPRTARPARRSSRGRRARRTTSRSPHPPLLGWPRPGPPNHPCRRLPRRQVPPSEPSDGTASPVSHSCFPRLLIAPEGARPGSAALRHGSMMFTGSRYARVDCWTDPLSRGSRLAGQLAQPRT